jgi:hypothetical protein
VSDLVNGKPLSFWADAYLAKPAEFWVFAYPDERLVDGKPGKKEFRPFWKMVRASSVKELLLALLDVTEHFVTHNHGKTLGLFEEEVEGGPPVVKRRLVKMQVRVPVKPDDRTKNRFVDLAEPFDPGDPALPDMVDEHGAAWLGRAAEALQIEPGEAPVAKAKLEATRYVQDEKPG